MCFKAKLSFLVFFCITLSELTPSTALRDVQLKLPRYINRGDNVVLTCEYCLEQEKLYAILWYKDDREFYRYNANDTSDVKNFILRDDINIDLSQSMADIVALSALERSGTGTYACVVETGAPYYRLSLSSAKMEVIDVPVAEPKMNMNYRIYNVDDFVKVNCSIDASPSLVNLTWLVNGQELLMSKQTSVFDTNDVTEAAFDPKGSKQFFNGQISAIIEKYRTTLYLSFKLQLKYFVREKLTLGCRAKTFNLRESYTQQIIALDSKSNQAMVYVPFQRTGNEIIYGK